ncbi:plastid division protein CDP1, chloroplastic [Dioscorea cayenensis subsp. rotundata]|uniref:Plastid division protein CDP1, chloroplastic n=1 Tax=Dioscorea cayennensis subsp. rotundata TaxID=55577 RepID=A0AB40BI20_DIOCR|nr:plastid division protein CDP1, chloroplastic [Dioscorea cayenensis subsp. rotundata]
MALAHAVSISPPLGFACVESNVFERRRTSPPGVMVLLAGKGVDGGLRQRALGDWRDLGRRVVRRSRRLNAAVAPVVESGQNRKTVEIPVTCYQILGVSEKAEKDEIVKAVMELKNSEIEDGYTADIVRIRQDILMDVRDKLLFEPVYAGDIKGNVAPKASLRIPWTWLPAALSLLQEVGEGKIALELGRTALQHADAKPYIHDLLLSMASAECSIAKTCFEKSKVSEGFEALARAQHLLRSEISLVKMPLLSQVEESLKELAPACTLELLGLPCTPKNIEHRQRAILALHELLRQGLNAEASCRVQDWPCFLTHAMNKLMASEIVDLLSWDTLAIARKNKKSLQSQHQRIMIDFNCFYVAMIAHIAFGFSSRQTEMISKAKTICECLMESEGTNLKFEEAFCSFLLGQGSEKEAAEKLSQLEIKGASVTRSLESPYPIKENKDKHAVNRALENWLKESVLGVFPETKNCAPSLTGFFSGPKRILSGGKQKLGNVDSVTLSHRSLPHSLSTNQVPEEPLHLNSTRHLGEAVRQLAPVNLQNRLNMSKSSGTIKGPSVQVNRNPGQAHLKFWEHWSLIGDITVQIGCATFALCILVGSWKLFLLQSGQNKSMNNLHPSQQSLSRSSHIWTMDHTPDLKSNFARKNMFALFGELLAMFRHPSKHASDAVSSPNTRPDDISSLSVAYASPANMLHRRQMPLEEAEALVRQWQDIKAEALGPNHQIQALSDILAESMLSRWHDLANAAKTSLCFWRFVLLQLSIVRADILSDDLGGEIAEIEVVLEEAAELVDESHSKNPNYYSTYKINYILRKHDDGSWKFCECAIEEDVR